MSAPCYTWWFVIQCKHQLERQVMTKNTSVLLEYEARRLSEKLLSRFASSGEWNARQKYGTQCTQMHAQTHKHTKSVLNTQKDIQSEELRRDPDGLDHDFRGIIPFLLNMHTHTEYVMIQSTSNTSDPTLHPPPSCVVYKQQTRATTKATLQLNKAALEAIRATTT